MHVERGDLELGLRALDIGPGLLDGDLVRPLIDDEQKIVLLDHLAFVDVDGIDEARHPGPNLDGLDRRKAAGIFVPFGNRLLQRVRRRDRRCGWSRAGGRLTVATDQQVRHKQ